MSFKLPALIVALAVSLAGCASAPRPVSQEVLTGIKRVSTVSVSADQFRRLYVGLTVFGNEVDVRPIADWGLDGAYEDQLGQAAAKAFSATYVKVDYPRADFLHANDLDGPWDAPAFWGPNLTAIEPAVRSLCGRESLDALLVVAARRSGDVFGGTNQAVVGAGIYARGHMGLLHYLAVVSLYDCKTGKAVATRNVGHKTAQGRGNPGFSLPTGPLAADIARLPTSQWTPAIEETLRTTLRELPGSAWDDTLSTMVPAR